MRLRLREACCPQTAFIEANGDLRAHRALRRESISRNHAKPVLPIALAAHRSQIPPSKRGLRSGNQSQQAIQYP
jgi:hypothetical protein